MALKVKYDSPAFEKGTEVDVAGLGMLKVGEFVTLTEDQERTFLSTSGDTVKNRLGSDPMFKVEGTAEVRGEKAPQVSTVVENPPPDPALPEAGDK